MSLKLVPFERLDAVSNSPCIVTMTVSVAVCEIFSVKEWCDLENRVRVLRVLGCLSVLGFWGVWGFGLFLGFGVFWGLWCFGVWDALRCLGFWGIWGFGCLEVLGCLAVLGVWEFGGLGSFGVFEVTVKGLEGKG